MKVSFRKIYYAGEIMGKFIINLRNKYDKLSKQEKKVADFFMSTSKNEIPLYITDVAKISNTSEATIVRFAKKLGFNGYQQLKIAIAQDDNYRPVNQNITLEDSAYDIFSKVCDDLYCSLEKTKSTLNPTALQTCCDKILSADKILVIGLGNSAAIAIDAAHKMLKLGLNAVAYTDNHMQAIAVSHTNEKSIVIGISHSGRSKDIIQALQIAKDNGATTVAITNISKTPLYKVSDIILRTLSDETNYRILGLTSRITQLVIVDAIYSYLVCHLPDAKEKIISTENALKTKKMN